MDTRIRSNFSMVLVAIIFGYACTPKSEGKLERSELIQPSGKESSLSSADQAEDQSEAVSPPNNIAGTYLSCVVDKSPSAESQTARVACGLMEEESQQKADLAKYISKPDFRMISDKAQISRRMLTSDPRWHVLFTVTANDLSSIQAALKSATVRLTGQSVDVSKVPLEQKAVLSSILDPRLSFESAVGLYTSVQSLAVKNTLLNSQTQYACRGHYTEDNGQHLGHYEASSRTCVFSYGTTAKSASKFVFIADDATSIWVESANGTVPTGSIPLGNEGNGQAQYLCRADVGGEGQIFGKFANGYGGCNVITSTGYLSITPFQVLTR